jgi:hypothetical protein
MCGDSANATDVSALMAGKTAKLCATDPPYLVSYDAKNHPSKNFSGKNKDWKGRYADKQKTEPLGPFYEAFLRQALAVCEANAAIYVWHASQRQIEVEKAMRDCGILVHQQIIWVKNKPVLTHSFYMWQHEPCFFGWKQGNKPKRNPGDFPTTVWQIDVPVLPGVESRHPTEKPWNCSPLQFFCIHKEETYATSHFRVPALFALPRAQVDAASRWRLSLLLWRLRLSGYQKSN